MTMRRRDSLGKFVCIAREVGLRLHVSFRGTLDSETTPEAGAALSEPLAGRDVTVILDLSKLKGIDTAGLAMIAAAQRDVESRDGHFILANAPDEVSQFLARGSCSPSSRHPSVR